MAKRFKIITDNIALLGKITCLYLKLLLIMISLLIGYFILIGFLPKDVADSNQI